MNITKGFFAQCFLTDTVSNANICGFKEICATGYFSETPMKEFEKLLSYIQSRSYGKVRLICPELNLKDKRDKKNLQALKKIVDAGAEIRVNNRIHARFLVAYSKSKNSILLGGLLILGSFDFNKDCIGLERHDAGIKTRHPDLVKSAIDFFDQIWNLEQSENLLEKYKDQIQRK